MNKDYYKVLGVDKSASAEEVKKAFYKLAHQHHPDKPGGDADKFKEANEAYQVLSNKEKRAQYDQFGQTFNSQGGGAGGFQGFNGQNVNFDMNDFGDLFGSFGDMFGFGSGGGRAAAQRQGDDLEMDLSLDFLEACFGIEKKLKYKRQAACAHCAGSGVEPGATIDTCPTCHGSGRVVHVQRTILGAVQMQTVCGDCQGAGQKASKACSDCRGQGIASETAEMTIKIPAGINNGEAVRFAGRGSAGKKGAPAGDLFVRVQVRSDKRWQRQGEDIHTKLDISYSEAVLGAKKEIETIDGQADLKIPEGAKSGQILSIKGRGVPRLKQNGRGDHLVELTIKVPASISRSQRKLLEELGKEGL